MRENDCSIKRGRESVENSREGERAEAVHPFRITSYLRKRMEQDAEGVLKRQFCPSSLELENQHGLEDPIGDVSHSPFPGLVHRYRDRVLLLAAQECFAYCRFCFRRCALGAKTFTPVDIEEAAAYIRDRRYIQEVIVSGGDPLTLSNKRLRDCFDRLQGIPHVGVLRIHTRAPIVLPSRVDDGLARCLESVCKPLYCVLHVNHPVELAEEVVTCCRKLIKAGVILLSQTVLLKGVNDSVEILSRLMRKLVENRIKPYYLHNCDPAKGTAHFRVDLQRGRDIVSELRNSISGICMPQFMLDIPHGYGKVPAGREYVRQSRGEWSVTDSRGVCHGYPWG